MTTGEGLDVVGKVMGQIIQEQLQVISEEFSVTGLAIWISERKRLCGHDFCSQIVDGEDKGNMRTHYFLSVFVNLKKAYDSVHRNAQWTVLAKCGMPPTMLNIIRSFHEGMQAGVRVGSAVTNCFEVRNGLRQGCTMVPTLFNIYFNAMVPA